MTSRREQIRDLLITELQDDGSLEPGEVVTTWTCLVGTHAIDEDGDNDGTVHTVQSDPQPATHEQLGMLRYRLLILEAVGHEVARRSMGDDQ